MSHSTPKADFPDGGGAGEASPAPAGGPAASTASDPSPVEAFIAAVEDRTEPGSSVLLTRGARRPARPAVRRTVAWALQGTSLRSLHDGWLEAAEHRLLCDRLRQRGPLQTGGCDGGVGAPVTVAWTTADGLVRVWVGGTLRLDHDDRWIRVWRGRCALIPRDDLRAVRVAVPRGRQRVALSLVRGNGQRREVVSRPLWGAALDPSYDRGDLVADCAWAVELARAMGEGFGVEVSLPPPLRQV